MPCFISVQLSKLPDGEQNADFTAPVTLLSSPCFQFCFAVAFSLLPGSQYHLFLILNLGLDQLTWFCPGVCPIRLPTRPSEPPIFTDAVTFWLQKRLPFNITPDSLEDLFFRHLAHLLFFTMETASGKYMFTVELGVCSLQWCWGENRSGYAQATQGCGMEWASDAWKSIKHKKNHRFLPKHGCEHTIRER